jgi:hypothetical protein
VSATVTIDQTEHTYQCTWTPRSFREGGDQYTPGCSCGWRGTAVHGIGNDVGQWNAHVGVGER